MNWLTDARDIGIALLLVGVNGFFVAAEFALVKVRVSQLDVLRGSGSLVGRVAQWLGQRLDASLSACQLGITMASLALGWVGEPAFADLLEPLFLAAGVTTPHLVHTITFIIAFSTITTLHLVIGEQAPKIFAIRRPEQILVWCALPLAVFYFLSYPLLWALNASTTVLLRFAGVDSANEHDSPHTEDEIRALVAQSHVHGELTRSEHSLINAVFEFDDLICRRVMVPRSNVVYFTVNQPLSECLPIAKQTKHTRYPICETSLDDAIGILHIKDLIDVDADDKIDFRAIVRTLHHVPETMPVRRLLRHFQQTHQLMALVDDEYGTVVGVVTLENVLEPIIGAVEDEFDNEAPPIIEEGNGRFVVRGDATLAFVNRRLRLNLEADDADTLSGYLTVSIGRGLQTGDKLDLQDAAVEIMEVDGTRATKLRVTLTDSPAE
jgi:CBS domain containing-hemolysin-like protein